MTDFWLFFTLGLRHVLDINGYDHVLFLVMLAAPYAFKDWRQVAILATLFTIGHTASLVLSVFGAITVSVGIVEFLIPVTILATALYNIAIQARRATKNGNINFIAITTLLFGIIHGLGFSNYFKILVSAKGDAKFLPLLEFAIGIESAQLIVVLSVLLLWFILQHFGRINRREWLLVTGAFTAGVVVPIIAQRKFW